MACLVNDVSLPRGESGLEFFRAIKTEMPDLKCIIVDTVASIRRASLSEKNYEETEAEFAPMRRLAHDLDLALMVVHHTRKDSGNPSTPIERIMGSQGIGATIETAIVLEQRPGSKDIIAHVVGKEVEGGEFAYRWDSPGFSFQGTPEVATLGSFQEKCYAFIKQHPRCMQKAIVDALDTDKGSVSRAGAKLIERGLVEKDQRDASMATS